VDANPNGGVDVSIDEIVSTVRPVDGEALLSPEVMHQIVRVVMARVRDEDAHARRVRAEQRVNAGRNEADYPD